MTDLPASASQAQASGAFNPGALKVSFEFFPPRTPQMEEALWKAVRRLAPLGPQFVSVTYGAGGGTRERTHATVRRILDETGLQPAAHLTCVGATRDEIDAIAHQYWHYGVRHIVALRGDPPKGQGLYRPTPGGYAYAADLTRGLRDVADFEISVAAYPETHPQAESLQSDLDNLKRKIDAGATRAITQFFFDPDVFFRFLDRARAAGIKAPIIPGVLPVTNCAKVLEFSRISGASVPRWMVEMFQGLDEDPGTRKLAAAAIAAEHCRILRARGIDQFHFYTLNRADLSYAICHVLGLRPDADISPAALPRSGVASPGVTS